MRIDKNQKLIDGIIIFILLIENIRIIMNKDKRYSRIYADSMKMMRKKNNCYNGRRNETDKLLLIY